VLGVAFAADGTRIATASHDKTGRAHVREIPSGRKTDPRPTGWLLGVRTLPDRVRKAPALNMDETG
jgi:hypothetical protein